MKLLLIFIALNVFNVILQTVKNIVTIKCGKTLSAIINAVAFGLYTIVTVYTMCDLPLAVKALVVALCNLVGVYVVKHIEEKMRKDKLWKVEATVHEPYATSLATDLEREEMSFNYIDGIGKYVIFNIFCETQADSKKAKEILDYHKAKYFVSESKNLA